jgi:hypothetical protein
MKNELIRIGLAARFIGCSTRWLATLADRGEIPAFRAPSGHRFFYLDDIEAYLKRTRVPACPTVEE